MSSMVRKMCMPLDALQPNLPISTSFILTCTSMSKTCYEDDQVWVNALVMRTLTNPLYRKLLSDKKQREYDLAMTHSCLFSWSFLNNRGYINKDGSATFKCDLQYRLHHHVLLSLNSFLRVWMIP